MVNSGAGTYAGGMGSGVRNIVVLATVSLTVLACGSPSTPGDAATANEHVGHVHGSPPPPAAALRNGERFLEVGLSRPYRPAPPEGGTDEYRCFLIDPKVTEATYLT